MAKTSIGGKRARAKRERRGLAFARNEISVMVFNGNYSRDGAIKAVAESMGTTIKQATRYCKQGVVKSNSYI